MLEKAILKSWRLLLFLLLIKCLDGTAQDSTFTYDASLVLASSTSSTPYWAYVNQNGNVPKTGNFIMGQWQAKKKYIAGNPRLFQWSAAATLITSYSGKEDIFFNDLFVAGKLGRVELMVGQRRNFTGLTDSSSLSTGSLGFSGNARQMPRVQLSLPEFLPIHFTHDFLSIKASYSDGLLQPTELLYGDTKFLPTTYLHQKSLFLRAGRPEQRISAYAGISHQVIWGGENRIWPDENLRKVDSYWYAMTSKTKNNKRIGDHIATLDIAFEWKGLNWSYLLYRQNLYETGSLNPLSHPEDGIAGLRLRRNNPPQPGSNFFTLQSIVIEIVSTKNQRNTSPLSGLSIFEQSNYYNSFIYKNGWSYRGMAIGTPLIPSQSSTAETLPTNTSQFSNNNRILAFHSGANMAWKGVTIIAKCTFSFNHGSYLTPFDNTKHQISASLQGEKKLRLLKGVYLTSAVFADQGEFYPNSLGVRLGIRKMGFIK